MWRLEGKAGRIAITKVPVESGDWRYQLKAKS
jgi:hypothetical protein